MMPRKWGRDQGDGTECGKGRGFAAKADFKDHCRTGQGERGRRSWADSFKSALASTMMAPRQRIQLRQEHTGLQRLRCPLLTLFRWGKLSVCQSAMALRGKRGASAPVQQVIPACSQAQQKKTPAGAPSLFTCRLQSHQSDQTIRFGGFHRGLPTFAPLHKKRPLQLESRCNLVGGGPTCKDRSKKTGMVVDWPRACLEYLEYCV